MTENIRFGPSIESIVAPLVLDFTFADHPGPVLIGNVGAGRMIRETVLLIEDAFDGNIEITIGDMLAQGRLQTVYDNYPDHVDRYNVSNCVDYAVDTDVYLFFPVGIPTVGSGRVIVFLD